MNMLNVREKKIIAKQKYTVYMGIFIGGPFRQILYPHYPGYTKWRLIFQKSTSGTIIYAQKCVPKLRKQSVTITSGHLVCVHECETLGNGYPSCFSDAQQKE